MKHQAPPPAVQHEVDVAANLANVRARMAAAAARCGRSLDGITLVAVSKTKPLSSILQAVRAGQRDFGENRVEEAWSKFAEPDSDWSLASLEPETWQQVGLHLIGPIQSRKTELAVACRPALIHAVDRFKIARRLDRHAAESGLVLDVLLEVNISGERSKFGFSPDGLWNSASDLLDLPHLRVVGMMTMPPYDPDPEKARPFFVAMRQLRDRLARRWPEAGWQHLSMGMSHDFEVAIEEGATIVRVGTAIFGDRP